MNKFENQNASELLTQLLDGELEQAQEEQLFTEMSSNTELQEQLSDTLAIRESIKKDSEAFSPPVTAVNGVFGSLGYAPPYPAALPGQKPFWAAFFRRAAVPAAVLVGAFVAYLSVNSDSLDTAPLKQNFSQVEREYADKSADAGQATVINITADRVGIPVASSMAPMAIPSDKEESPVNVESEKPMFNIVSIGNSAPYAFTELPAGNLAMSGSFAVNTGTAGNIPATGQFWAGDRHGYISGYSGIGSYGLSIMPLRTEHEHFEAVVGGEFGMSSFNHVENGEKEYFYGMILANVQPKDFRFYDVNPEANLGIGSSGISNLLVKGGLGLNYQPEFLRFGISAGYEYWYAPYTVETSTGPFVEKSNFNANKGNLYLRINISF
jgi:hypothetical protein